MLTSLLLQLKSAKLINIQYFSTNHIVDSEKNEIRTTRLGVMLKIKFFLIGQEYPIFSISSKLNPKQPNLPEK